MMAQTKVVKVEKSKNWLNLGYFLKVEPIGSPHKLYIDVTKRLVKDSNCLFKRHHSGGGFDNERCYLSGGVGWVYMEISVTSSSFCYEPKTALKNIVFKKLNHDKNCT